MTRRLTAPVGLKKNSRAKIKTTAEILGKTQGEVLEQVFLEILNGDHDDAIQKVADHKNEFTNINIDVTLVDEVKDYIETRAGKNKVAPVLETILGGNNNG